jgi:hypothetical protein
LTFDQFFARLVRLTGWGLGVFGFVSGRLDATQDIALVLAFVGFELVARKKDKVLEEEKES